ncbi:MAG TPA: glycoside hydrolase family 13 protein, partial [Protaetiibacter sp.]|nr:glycoside hydrolase family 13 protein [Protaetiibacter sp.]
MTALAAQPHHDGSPLYVSTQEPALGEIVGVRMRVPRAFGGLRRVRVRSNPDREPGYADARVVHEHPDAVWWQAEVEVANPVHGYRWLLEGDDGTT